MANLVVEIGGALEFDGWVTGSTETLIFGGEEIYDLGGDSSLAMEHTIAPSLLVFKYFISTSFSVSLLLMHHSPLVLRSKRFWDLLP